MEHVNYCNNNFETIVLVTLFPNMFASKYTKGGILIFIRKKGNVTIEETRLD